MQEPALSRDEKRRVQPVMVPGVRVSLGPRAALGLDGTVPVGGPLGGDAFGVGLWARVGF